MATFVNIFLLALGWVGGILAFGYAVENFKQYKTNKSVSSLIIAILIVVIMIAADAYAFTVSTFSGVMLLLGLLMAFFTVVDPFALTAKKAHEIGVEAEKKAALKAQEEEQKQREKDEMKENAKIYYEAKKAEEKKED